MASATVENVAWWPGIKAAVRGFRDHHVSDLAAGLTYYAMLAVFPTVIALVAVLGLLGNASTVDGILNIIERLGPGSATQTFRGAVEGVITQGPTSGITLFVSLGVALWSASGYVGAFMRASNKIFELREHRPFWQMRPLQLLVTLVLVLLAGMLSVLLAVSGGVAEAIGAELGLGDTTVALWGWVKWPLAIAIFMVILGVLYYPSPDVRQRKLRWVTPGALVAVFGWIVASIAFAFYVSTLGSYAKTYGAMAGVVVFLLWLWITNLALLFGQELNAAMFPRVVGSAVGGSPEEE